MATSRKGQNNVVTIPSLDDVFTKKQLKTIESYGYVYLKNNSSCVLLEFAKDSGKYEKGNTTRYLDFNLTDMSFDIGSQSNLKPLVIKTIDSRKGIQRCMGKDGRSA